MQSFAYPKLDDGERVFISGPVEPLAPALKSPVTGTECVAYQYHIDHEVPGLDGPPRRVRDYWGMAASPYQIRTPAGPVRILGYARLEQPPFVAMDDEAFKAAEAYLYATSYRHPESPGEKYGSLAEPLEIESDTFADDICSDGNHLHLRRDHLEELLKLRRVEIVERSLAVGEMVSASGCYSQTKGALVPTSQGLKQLRVTTYLPENWAAENRQWGMTYIRWGIGFSVVTIACALATRWW
jgi:hypothetical protein